MGYVNDDKMTQFIPPWQFQGATGTYTIAAGAVAGTWAFHRAAAASTGVVTIPILPPGNSGAARNKGSLLKSIEVDYELLLAGATSVTAALAKVTRGANGAVAVVSAVTITQDQAAAVAAATQGQHKLTVTVTTPEWHSNAAYYFLNLTCVCGATVTLDFLGAIVNYTFKA